MTVAIGTPNVASADTSDSTYSVEATLLTAPLANVVTTQERQDPTVTVRATTSSHRALGFSLEPGTPWIPEETLRPIPQGLNRSGLNAAQLASIAWLATEYFNIPDRIPTPETAGFVDYRTDTGAERAAYQLAIWFLSAETDRASLPDNVVTRRARLLADLAEASDTSSSDSAEPLAKLQLDLTKTEQYPRGERLVAHLEQTDPGEGDVGGALIQFTSGATGEPLRVMQTSRKGTATIDLPNNQELLGEVYAQWRTTIPPGTILSGSTGDLVLYQSLPVVIRSASVAHEEPKGFIEWSERAALLVLHRIQAMPAQVEMFLILVTLLLLALGAWGILSALSQRFRRRYTLLAAFIAIVVLAAGSLHFGSEQSLRYRTEWATRTSPPDEQSAEVLIVDVKQTSYYRSSFPDYFSGSCAVDRADSGQPAYMSAWLSARGRGTGEFIVLELDEPTLVTRIDLVPGWFDTRDNYDSTGKPRVMLIFTDSGHVAELSIEDDPDYTSGPLPSTLNLSDEPLPVATHIFLQVTRIHGDVRTYSGISHIAVHGIPMAEPPPDAGIIDRELTPDLEDAPPCGAPNR